VIRGARHWTTPGGGRRPGRFSRLNRRIAGLTVGILAVAGIVIGIVRWVDRPEPAPPPPPPPPKVRVMLDAGHGGRDPGATVDGVLEKEINLQIVEALRDRIDAEPEMRAVLTRAVDVFLSLDERVERANAESPDLYISIHANSFTQTNVAGVEVWVASDVADSDPGGVLARMVVGALSEATGSRNRGIQRGEIYLRHMTFPAISVEVGFLTNPDERANLLDPAYQETIAEGILEGIRQYLEWADARAG